MAIKKTVELDVDTGSSNSALKEIINLFKRLVKEEKEAQKETEKFAEEVEEVGKAGKSAKGGVSILSKGFKILGKSLKATGIGWVIGLFLTLKEALGQNQKVVDTLSSAMGTVSIVVNKVFEALTDAYTAVSKATGGFDALGKVLSGLVTVGIAPLKIGFYGIKLGLQQAQLAWEKSFFGDNDPKTVKELNKAILETETNIRTVSAETTKAGKDIVDNFNEAVSEVGALSSGIIENVSKVSIKASFEQSKLTQQLANNAKLATAEQSKLIEKYDIQAEKLRQVRDNDLLSIEKRKKANDDLKKILDNQEKAMIAQANAVLASAEAELKKSNNIENQVALIDAQANKLGVVAQIEGFRSEQDVNKNALIKETNELVQSGIEADTQRALNQQKFNTELEEDELKKLERQKTDLEKEREIEEQRLQLKIDSFALGTQARLDAENELKDRLQEIDQEITTNQNEQNKKRIDNKTKSDAEDLKRENLIATAKKQLQSDVFKLAGELAEKGSAASKAVQVAQTIMSTIQGVQAAYTTAQKSPYTALFPAYPVVQAGLAGAFGAVSVQKLLSTPTKSSGGSGAISGASGASPTPPPAFNLIGNSGVNQIENTVQGENTPPIQAFVVGSQVTNQQEIDGAQADSASLG